MSLDFTQLIFPNNVVELMATRFEMIDSDLTVLRRELRLNDPNFSIGVAAVDWSPVPASMEFLGTQGTHASTIEQYMISVMAFVKVDDEESGLIAHSVLSKSLRTILASDLPLRAQLGGLTSTFNGETERMKKWWVQRARYHSNKLQGTNMYLTVNDVMIEVEKV
jgi:hypothetical protein